MMTGLAEGGAEQSRAHSRLHAPLVFFFCSVIKQFQAAIHKFFLHASPELSSSLCKIDKKRRKKSVGGGEIDTPALVFFIEFRYSERCDPNPLTGLRGWKSRKKSQQICSFLFRWKSLNQINSRSLRWGGELFQRKANSLGHNGDYAERVLDFRSFLSRNSKFISSTKETFGP